MKFRLGGPIQVTSQQVFTATGVLSPDVTFVPEHCYMPNKVTVGVPDDSGYLRLVNNGDAGDVLLVVEIKGGFSLVWEGYLENMQGVDLSVTLNFDPETWTESEVITATFYCGYPGEKPDTIIPTDSISFDIYVYVPKTDWMMIMVTIGIVAGVGIMIYSVIPKRMPVPIRR